MGAFIKGFGAYKIMGNSLMAGGLRPPEIINSHRKGAIVIRHREFIRDITATTTFTPITFDINPGLLASYPWLSQVAQNFEEYRFSGLIYEYISTSSDAVLAAAASSSLGSVIMATQYNSLNPAFRSKSEMANYEYANSTKPSISMIHPVECKRSQLVVDKKYVRTAAVPENADERLYDVGTFTIATVGMQAAGGVLGELWATFEIELAKPKIGVAGDLTDKFAFSFGHGITNAIPLGTQSGAAGNLRRLPNSTLGGVITQPLATGNRYSFPSGINRGEFCFNIIWRGGAQNCAAPAITPTNCVLVTAYTLVGAPLVFTTTVQSNSGVAGTTDFFQEFIILVTAENAFIDFGAAGALPTAVTTCDMTVNSVPIGLEAENF